MGDLESELLQIIRQHALITPGTTVLIGVSGGPDSVALLQLLGSLSSRLFYNVVVLYVDHGLRPDEIPAEIACVRQHADSIGAACKVVTVDTPSLVREEKMSVEHAARILRYQALRHSAAQLGAERIAVAHTADDQVEELLLRLLRGSGRKGLSGMKMREGDIIRPLLTTRKQQLLKYLHEGQYSYCHDSSNDDPRFLRNRVRNILLPLLEKDFDPGVRSALLKTAANLAEDEDFLAEEVECLWHRLVREDTASPPCFSLDRKEMTKLHPCLQRRVVERLFWELGSTARYDHIMLVLSAAASGRTGSELHFSRGLRMQVFRDVLRFSYPRGKRPWRGRITEGDKETDHLR